MRIYEHFKDQISTTKQSGGVVTLQGVFKENITVELPFVIENSSYFEPFLCTSETNGLDTIKEETEVPIHGILGNNFFVKHGWVIDFERMEVYTTK